MVIGLGYRTSKIILGFVSTKLRYVGNKIIFEKLSLGQTRTSSEELIISMWISLVGSDTCGYNTGTPQICEHLIACIPLKADVEKLIRVNGFTNRTIMASVYARLNCEILG